MDDIGFGIIIGAMTGAIIVMVITATVFSMMNTDKAEINFCNAHDNMKYKHERDADFSDMCYKTVDNTVIVKPFTNIDGLFYFVEE